jgi:hypothetical protein
MSDTPIRFILLWDNGGRHSDYELVFVDTGEEAPEVAEELLRLQDPAGRCMARVRAEAFEWRTTLPYRSEETQALRTYVDLVSIARHYDEDIAARRKPHLEQVQMRTLFLAEEMLAARLPTISSARHAERKCTRQSLEVVRAERARREVLR